MAAISPTVMQGTAGRAMEHLPAVITQDGNGNVVSGVLVTFVIVEGLGVVSGNVVRSNSEGIARLGGWRLGTKAGANVVSARSGLLSQVTFHANAVAGPACCINKTAGDQQGSEPGTITAVPPQVNVTDSWGNGIAGIPVTFAVTSGGGSLTEPLVTTDSTGSASAGGWRLGPRGNQSITAAVTGIPPVTFTALAIAFAPCATDNILPEGRTVRSAFTSQSCRADDGRFHEVVEVRVTAASAYEFKLVSDDFDARLELMGESPIAFNDDHGLSTNARIKALLVPGVYTLVVSSSVPEAMGNYSVSFSRASDSVEGCEEVFIVRGVVAIQSTGPNDCVLTQSDEQADRFRVFLRAGSTITIEAEDLSYSWHLLSLYGSAGELLATATTAGYIYTLTFAAVADGYYRLDVSNGGENGAQYRLTVR